MTRTKLIEHNWGLMFATHLNMVNSSCNMNLKYSFQNYISENKKRYPPFMNRYEWCEQLIIIDHHEFISNISLSKKVIFFNIHEYSIISLLYCAWCVSLKKKNDCFCRSWWWCCCAPFTSSYLKSSQWSCFWNSL